MTASRGLTTVEKSLEIIQTLEENGAMGPTELADELGIHKSTAYTHLRTLDEHGYAIREKNGYRLSFRFLKHGGVVRNRLEIYNVAKDNIRMLAKKTGKVANFGVIEDDMGVLIHRSEQQQAVSDNAPVGSYTHLHATAYGKAMLAELPEEDVERIIANEGLPRRTENTITDKTDLLEQLETVRDRGYAVDREETSLGIYCVGSAITDAEDQPIGGVSITGAANELSNSAYLDELAEQIKNEVNKIEVKMMYE